MNTQQQSFAATFEPGRNSKRLQQHAAKPSFKCTEPRRSPLPSVREIDDALERKYGAERYREISI